VLHPELDEYLQRFFIQLFQLLCNQVFQACFKIVIHFLATKDNTQLGPLPILLSNYQQKHVLIAEAPLSILESFFEQFTEERKERAVHIPSRTVHHPTLQNNSVWPLEAVCSEQIISRG
jgi:hypothetical protein